MIKVPAGLWRKYAEQLGEANVPPDELGDYRKWLRYYLDFCRKYGHAYAAGDSLPPFLEKLASKGQSDAQRGQAARAVGLYHRMLAESAAGAQSGRGVTAGVPRSDLPGRSAPPRQRSAPPTRRTAPGLRLGASNTRRCAIRSGCATTHRGHCTRTRTGCAGSRPSRAASRRNCWIRRM